MITLEQFKNQTLGGSYGNPGTGTFKGQCVSYVRQYMELVLGIKTIVNGHASNYYNSAFMAQYFDKVSDRQDGDILCWGDDPGNWTGKEGHIAISYGGRILNQNFGGSLKVTINDFFPQGYQGALRLKRSEEMATERGVNIVTRLRLGRAPNAVELAGWVGKLTIDQIDDAIVKSAEYKEKVNQVKKAKDLLNSFRSIDMR